MLRLIAGMVEETKAEELIQYLMRIDGRNEKFANLMLAAGCLSEVRNWKTIEKTSEALWKRFVEEVVRYDPPGYEARLKDLIAGPIRRAAIEQIAATWIQPKTRHWLWSTAKDDRDPILREVALQELVRRWKEEPDTLPLVKGLARYDESRSVRLVAVLELGRGWKQDPETLTLLKERVYSDGHPFVRQAAVLELARGWKDDPETLPLVQDRARVDRASDVRQAAVRELARCWKEHPETLPWLKERVLSDEDAEVRRAAAEELARGWGISVEGKTEKAHG